MMRGCEDVYIHDIRVDAQIVPRHLPIRTNRRFTSFRSDCVVFRRDLSPV